MKQLFVVLFLSFSFNLFAQNKEGVIEYKETIKLDIKEMKGLNQLPDNVKEMLTKDRIQNFVLYFNPTSSFYTNTEEAKDENSSYKSDDSNNEIQIDIQTNQPKTAYYKDLKKNETVSTRDIFGKEFLVTGKNETKKWKMTNETKEILGYTCKKAILLKDEKNIVAAWFSPQIPVSVGPPMAHQLPGAVLEISSNNGMYNVTASKVDFKKVEADKIQKPKKGKKVTEEQYDKIMKEKMKEMQEMYGGQNGTVIQIETSE